MGSFWVVLQTAEHWQPESCYFHNALFINLLKFASTIQVTGFDTLAERF